VYKIHKSADGSEMLIAQMSNEHLLNMIRLITDKISNARMILEGGNPATSRTDSIMISTINPQFSFKHLSEKAEQILIHQHKRLQDYVIEAALRGLEISPMLQSAYGRSERIPDYSAFTLEAGDDDYSETLYQF